MEKVNLFPCPYCGRVPELAYVCGEYFILAEDDSCSACDDFPSMHSSYSIVEREWNDFVLAVKSLANTV